MGVQILKKCISGFFDMPIFEKVCFGCFFQKWLPRPNHSAHIKGIEILCKTPVPKRQELPPGPNSIRTNSKYSSPARMSTWISRWRRRRRRRRPKNSPHLVKPLEYHVQEPNIPFRGIPHFDYTYVNNHIEPNQPFFTQQVSLLSPLGLPIVFLSI